MDEQLKRASHKIDKFLALVKAKEDAKARIVKGLKEGTLRAWINHPSPVHDFDEDLKRTLGL